MSQLAEAPEALILVVVKATGLGFTVIFAVFVAVQPEALLPVTVYVVVSVGFAVTDVPVV